MIHHTVIVAFDKPIPASELDQYLKEFEKLAKEFDPAESVAARQPDGTS
ncbi:hypothetical protein [Streptomyces sp. NPDC005549]